jgi:hypothetical protein
MLSRNVSDDIVRRPIEIIGGNAMRIFSKAAVVSAALLTLAAHAALGQTPATRPVGTPTPGRSDALALPSGIQLKALQKSAASAQAHISANPSDRIALARALKVNDTAKVKALLIKAGFTLEQVTASKLTVHEIAGGGTPSERTKITIVVRCCPLEIIITIQF